MDTGDTGQKAIYEFAIVCKPGQESPKAPDNLIDNRSISTLGLAGKFHWMKLGDTAGRLLDEDASASIRLTMSAGGSWPMRKVEDWPETLGLWQCSCKASPKWKGTFVLIRRCDRSNVVLTMEYVPDVLRLPSMDIHFNTFSGRRLLTCSINAMSQFSDLLEEVFNFLDVPEHRQGYYKFAWAGSNKPMTCTSKAKMKWPIVDVLKAGASTKPPHRQYSVEDISQCVVGTRFAFHGDEGMETRQDSMRARLMSQLAADLAVAMTAAPEVDLGRATKRQRIQ